jgi:hypothetical protein
MLPKPAAAAGPYLPAYQYCPPSLAHHHQATGPISVNTSMASGQYPYHHHQLSQQHQQPPVYYGGNGGYAAQRSHQPGSFSLYPGISAQAGPGAGMPPVYVPGMHHGQFGGQQQFNPQPPQRRGGGWQNDNQK